MLALLQRVAEARVTVAGEIIAQIRTGLLVFIGVERGDTKTQAERMAQRLLGYRIFSDAEDHMNLSLEQIQGGLLLVPQFTLPADTRKGARPSFSPAAPPAEGRALFDHLLDYSKKQYAFVQSGQFGANMQVALVNDGPVTFMLQVPPSQSALTPATKALEEAGIAFEILSYEHDPRSDAYGLEAAQALQLDKHTVFKTLLIELEPKALAVAILPVHQRLNLKAAAKALGAKRAHLALPQAAERSTGYVVGGISPLGQKKRLRTVLDASALALEHLHVSGGRRGLQVRLAVDDLIAVTNAVVAAVV